MKRDPDADLKVCEAADPPPWSAGKKQEDGRVFVESRPGWPVAVADGVRHANFIVAARDGWEPYIKVYLRLLRFIADFERDTKALPLGEEDSQKGSSAYNWRRGFIGELKAALAEVDKL